MRKLVWAVTVALSAIFGIVASAAGYALLGGAYNNASIGDGVLGVCFANNTPVYTHRAILMSGLRQWGTAKNITLSSNGRCDNDGSNLQVGWAAGDCTGPTIVLAWVVPGSYTNVYSTAWLNYNANCGSNFYWWGGTNPVPSGQFDAYSIATHEMGHAYGVAHTPIAEAGEQVMEPDAPCIANSNRYTSLSDDDADAIRARYPGLVDTAAAFNLSAGCIN